MSNILITDGFDMYNGTGTGTGVQSRWVSALGVMTAGRFGGQAMTVSQGHGNFGSMYLPLPSAQSQVAIGFAIYMNNIPASGSQQQVPGEWQLNSGATGLVGFNPNINGGIDVYRLNGNVLLGSTANNILSAGQWGYLEMEIVLSATVGRVTLYLNGTQVLNLTGVNNVNGALVTADRFTLNHFGDGFYYLMDDLYILDTAAKIGECRIETLRPSGDNTKVFTPDSGTTNYNRVNETLVDGDTSYVQAAAVGNRDLYGITALSSTPANIYAVNVVSFARKTDATARQLNNSIKSGTTDSDGANLTLLSAYGRLDRIIPNDPNTSAAWSPPAVNALLIGPKVAS